MADRALMERNMAHAPSTANQRAATGRLWAAIPNFVDCSVFCPANDGAERERIRASFGIPGEALVVGCVAAVKKDHKRIDHLMAEVVRWTEDRGPGGLQPCGPFLLVAGAATDESAALVAAAEAQLPGRHRILLDCPRPQMPDLYRAMDVFVLPSLFEMMPIALLEAMASGLPCLVNRHPVLQWMIGEATRSTLASTEEPAAPAAGMAIDMAAPGALAQALAGLSPEWMAIHGAAALGRALNVFSTGVVIDQYIAYYRQVMEQDVPSLPVGQAQGGYGQEAPNGGRHTTKGA